jgi:hypothetical protein
MAVASGYNLGTSLSSDFSLFMASSCSRFSTSCLLSSDFSTDGRSLSSDFSLLSSSTKNWLQLRCSLSSDFSLPKNLS